jgi:hypothetical protein
VRLLLFILLLAAAEVRAAVYQWSVPVGKTPERRAYLWIPETCRQVRGVLLGLQNMKEQNMFEDPAIRQACADCNLAIVWIAPGADQNDALSLDFKTPAAGAREVVQILDDLANDSGYTELKFAPILVVGHSAASPFVWGLGSQLPARVFAAIPYKGYFLGAPDGLPILYVSSEWAEWGEQWGSTWRKDGVALEKMRQHSANCLLGEFVDVGTGHFQWNPASAKIIALFIRKAVQYRLPENAPPDQPVKLLPISPASGCLVRCDALGTSRFKAVPASQWQGDPKSAFWYFDSKMATAVHDYMTANLRKKPQMIDFTDNGKPVPLTKNGFVEIHPRLLADGVTFKVEATYLDRSPTTNLFSDETLGHAASSVLFRVSSGGLKQTGPDTFRVWLGRNSVERQGPPWEPWVLAFNNGDREFRGADRPAHVWINVRNKQGQPQSIEFPAIPDQIAGAGKSVPLAAEASSGLPVQYWVVSGPAEMEGDRLRLEPVPPRAKFPVRVIVAAYQWGRGAEPKIQSAGPVMKEFLLRKPEAAAGNSLKPMEVK